MRYVKKKKYSHGIPLQFSGANFAIISKSSKRNANDAWFELGLNRVGLWKPHRVVMAHSKIYKTKQCIFSRLYLLTLNTKLTLGLIRYITTGYLPVA